MGHLVGQHVVRHAPRLRHRDAQRLNHPAPLVESQDHPIQRLHGRHGSSTATEPTGPVRTTEAASAGYHQTAHCATAPRPRQEGRPPGETAALSADGVTGRRSVGNGAGPALATGARGRARFAQPADRSHGPVGRLVIHPRAAFSRTGQKSSGSHPDVKSYRPLALRTHLAEPA